MLLLGFILYVVPSPIYVGVVKAIADTNASTGQQIVYLVTALLIMLWLIEIPMLILLIFPERGARILESINAWFARNGRVAGAYISIGAGLYLVGCRTHRNPLVGAGGTDEPCLTRRLQTLRELLEVDGRDVLDVGCGEGGLVRRLALDGARAVGVDPLPSALERARLAGAGVPGAGYVAGAAEDLPFPDESFDAVIFFNSLHHVPVQSMDGALSEAARVLRAGACLYVQEPVAAGSAFELLRPVDDETGVRREAQDALRRAAEGTFTSIERRELVLRVRYEDFDALRAHVVGVDPARAAALEENDGVVRATFQRLGRPVDGGYEFEQPLHVELMRRGAGHARPPHD